MNLFHGITSEEMPSEVTKEFGCYVNTNSTYFVWVEKLCWDKLLIKHLKFLLRLKNNFRQNKYGENWTEFILLLEIT